MKLFQRVRLIVDTFAGSQANLGRELGVHERTFQNYLKEERQDNLWPLLENMCKLYPDVRREWLWWGEGDMLQNALQETHPAITPPPDLIAELAILRADVDRLRAELDEANRLNRQLITRLLFGDAGDKGERTNTDAVADKTL